MNFQSEKYKTAFLLALFPLLLWVNGAFCQTEFNFVLNGLVKDMDSKDHLEGASIQLFKTKGNQKVSTQPTGPNGRFKFQFEPNQEYTIKVCKQGYVCKIISISTMNVATGDGITSNYKFDATIELFEEVKGVDYSILEKPIGQIFYNETMKVFEWTADPFTRTKIEELEEEVLKKQKEARLAKYKEEEEKRNAEEEARKKAELEAKNRKKAEEDALKNKEEEAKRKSKEEEESRKKQLADAKLKADEEAKRKLKEKEDADAAAKRKLKEEEHPRQAALLGIKQKAEEEQRRKLQEKENAQAEAQRKAAESARAKELAEAEAIERKKEELKRKAEQDAKLKADAKAALDAKRKADLDERARKLKEQQKIYVKSIDIEQEEMANYIITKTTIQFNEGGKIVYKKIIYNWGHTYFKKDEYDLSSGSYYTEINRYVVRVD